MSDPMQEAEDRVKAALPAMLQAIEERDAALAKIAELEAQVAGLGSPELCAHVHAARRGFHSDPPLLLLHHGVSNR